VKVAPSIIAADFTKLQREIRAVERARPQYLHLDVMDGVFVPNITFGPMIVDAIDRMTTLKLDVHLMIVKPERYIKQFIEAGADLVSFHLEATRKPRHCIRSIRSSGKKAGLAISPDTPFEPVIPYLPNLDFILIMSVHPGFYGQKFITPVSKKIEQARAYLKRHRWQCLIEVDGGIYAENACRLKSAGADIIVSGAGVFKTGNYTRAVARLQCSTD
jgi:ribulose-phosphate 3-epimerase